MPAKKKSVTQAQGKTLEAQLWDAADKMRGAVPPTDYQHVCLGLVFLRYLSAAFARKHAELLDTPHADAEDPEEPSGARQTAADSPKGERGGANQYQSDKVVWVPEEARWSHLQATAKQPTIGMTVDDAMVAIECDNARLKGVLPKDYARPGIDTALRGSAFLQSEAKPQVVSEAKDNFRKDDDVRWQWSGATWTTRQGCPQGERGGVHQFGVPPKTAPRVRAHWECEASPQVASEARDNNANFAWVQHRIHHLAPQTALRDSAIFQSEASPQVVSAAKDNMAGFVLANGSMSSNQSGEVGFQSAFWTKSSRLSQRATA